MIWIPEAIRSRSSLSGYIKDYLLRSGLVANTIQTHDVEDLSQALSVYLESSSDRAGFFVEDGNLLLLASQALKSVGEGKAATRLLMLGSGFARPVSWLVTEQDAGWTLDVARISEAAHGGLEIIFFRCLHAALDALADDWSAHSGQVVIVLRGAEEAGAMILRRPAASQHVQGFVAEVEAACRDKLQHLARQYEWASVPQLLKAATPAKSSYPRG